MWKYWARVFCRAWNSAFGFVGSNRETLSIAALTLAAGGAIRWWLAGWDEVVTDLVDTALYIAAPTAILAMTAFGWNLLREPARMDAEFRSKLAPLDYDPAFAEKLMAAVKAGQALVSKTRRRHMGDRLDEEFNEWCNFSSVLLRGKVAHHEWIGFETATPDDFSWGDGALQIRVNKLRFILLRYCHSAPPTGAPVEDAEEAGNEQ
jgi:hypothetical protein